MPFDLHTNLTQNEYWASPISRSLLISNVFCSAYLNAAKTDETTQVATILKLCRMGFTMLGQTVGRGKTFSA